MSDGSGAVPIAASGVVDWVKIFVADQSWKQLSSACLSIIFACYDGHTYIRWRTPSGEERLGLLSRSNLSSLTVVITAGW